MPDHDDLDRSLSQFDQGLHVHPLPAPEVRRRGDRLRRRNVVLASVGGVAAVAVFVGVPAAVVAGDDGRDNIQPAPSIEPTPTEPTPTEPTPTEPTPTDDSPSEALADFPLTLGYPETNGSDGSRVEVTGKPGVTAFQICGNLAWDPAVDTTDVIGAEYAGEAEDFRSRTLVVYSSEDAAAQAVAVVTAAVEACPEEVSDDESGGARLYEIVDSDLGEESVAWTTRYRTPGGLTDTGLTVNHLVRVGGALLVSYEYGEGGGSAQTIASAIQRATEQAEAIVEEMRDL